MAATVNDLLHQLVVDPSVVALLVVGINASDLNDAKDKFNDELAKLISDPYKKIKEQRRKRKNSL